MAGRRRFLAGYFACSACSACNPDEGQGSLDSSGSSSDASGSSEATGESSDASASDTGMDTGGCSDESYICDTGCCQCPVPGVATAQPLGAAVALARAGDVTGDDHLDVVVAWTDGGVSLFVGRQCGEFFHETDLPGLNVTGIDLGLIDDADGLDLLVFTADLTLSAYAGADLALLFENPLTGLSNAGQVLAVAMDGDPDHDAAAFDATHANLLRVENTGSGFEVRTQVALPPGIERVAAGALGGGSRDELLFLGGGLVEVVSVADFDFSDIRFLSNSAHGFAAFGDLDGDGDGDVAVSAGSGLERWAGDGNTVLTQDAAAGLGGAVSAVAIQDHDGDLSDEVIVATPTGLVVLDSPSFEPLWQIAIDDPALMVAGGDLSAGDGRDDVIAVTAVGDLWVWPTE